MPNKVNIEDFPKRFRDERQSTDGQTIDARPVTMRIIHAAIASVTAAPSIIAAHKYTDPSGRYFRNSSSSGAGAASGTGVGVVVAEEAAGAVIGVSVRPTSHQPKRLSTADLGTGVSSSFGTICILQGAHLCLPASFPRPGVVIIYDGRLQISVTGLSALEKIMRDLRQQHLRKVQLMYSKYNILQLN